MPNFYPTLGKLDFGRAVSAYDKKTNEIRKQRREQEDADFARENQEALRKMNALAFKSKESDVHSKSLRDGYVAAKTGDAATLKRLGLEVKMAGRDIHITKDGDTMSFSDEFPPTPESFVLAAGLSAARKKQPDLTRQSYMESINGHLGVNRKELIDELKALSGITKDMNKDAEGIAANIQDAQLRKNSATSSLSSWLDDTPSIQAADLDIENFTKQSESHKKTAQGVQNRLQEIIQILSGDQDPAKKAPAPVDAPVPPAVEAPVPPTDEAPVPPAVDAPQPAEEPSLPAEPIERGGRRAKALAPEEILNGTKIKNYKGGEQKPNEKDDRGLLKKYQDESQEVHDDIITIPIPPGTKKPKADEPVKTSPVAKPEHLKKLENEPEPDKPRNPHDSTELFKFLGDLTKEGYKKAEEGYEEAGKLGVAGLDNFGKAAGQISRDTDSSPYGKAMNHKPHDDNKSDAENQKLILNTIKKDTKNVKRKKEVDEIFYSVVVDGTGPLDVIAKILKSPQYSRLTTPAQKDRLQRFYNKNKKK